MSDSPMEISPFDIWLYGPGMHNFLIREINRPVPHTLEGTHQMTEELAARLVEAVQRAIEDEEIAARDRRPTPNEYARVSAMTLLRELAKTMPDNTPAQVLSPSVLRGIADAIDDADPEFRYGPGMHNFLLREMEVGQRVAMAEDDEHHLGPLFMDDDGI